MNKTIYIRDEDVPTWDRAKELAGNTISQVIVAGLERFIREKEAEAATAKGYERLEVAYSDAEAKGIPRRKAFHGKWVFAPNRPLELCNEDGSTLYFYALAITAKGNVVVLAWREETEAQGASWRRFYVFASLDEAAMNSHANPVALEAIRKLGVPLEELDI